MKRAALVAALTAAAMAPAAQSAARDPVISFLEPIYHHLDSADQFNAPYAPDLADLIRRDRAYVAATHEVGALDWGPLCGCQDLDRYHLRGIRGTAVGRRIRAVVTFQIASAAQSVTLDIVRNGNGFAIADVRTPSVPSLRALLAREVPKEEAALRSHGASPRPS